jgi:hypothetical protein
MIRRGMSSDNSRGMMDWRFSDVRFSAYHKMVIFTSKLFGLSFVFGVEVEKTVPTQ